MFILSWEYLVEMIGYFFCDDPLNTYIEKNLVVKFLGCVGNPLTYTWEDGVVEGGYGILCKLKYGQKNKVHKIKFAYLKIFKFILYVHLSI